MLSEEFARRLMNFAKCPEKMIKAFCSQKFSSNASYGHGDCSFDYHIQNFSTKSRKGRLLSKGGKPKELFLKKNILKKIQLTLRMHFWRSCQKIFDKIRYASFQSPSMITKAIISWRKSIVPQNYPMEMQSVDLTNPWKHNRLKPEKNAGSPKLI